MRPVEAISPKPPLSIRQERAKESHACVRTVATLASTPCLEFIAQRAVVSALEVAAQTLPLPRHHQVFDAARSLSRRLTAFRAPGIPLHPQLVLPLPRNWHRREFILDRCFHRENG